MAGQATSVVPDKGVRAGVNRTGTELAVSIFVAYVNPGTEKGDVEVPTGQGATADGVTMEAIPDDEFGDIQIEGIAILQATSVALAIGAKVTCSAAGLAELAASGDLVHGTCVSGNDADDIVMVELNLGGVAIVA